MVQLTAPLWTVSAEADRVGLRLAGSPLEITDTATGPSEPAVHGAVQIPPSGNPILFGVDHAVTAGYPVVAVVRSRQLDRLGQLRPGQQLRFRLEPPGKRSRLRLG